MKLFSHETQKKGTQRQPKDRTLQGAFSDGDGEHRGKAGLLGQSHFSDTERKVIKIAFYAQATRLSLLKGMGEGGWRSGVGVVQ